MFIFFSAVLLSVALIVSPLRAADPITGVWKTIDDKTHKVRGTVRLYDQDGAIFGKIQSGTDPKEAADVCDKCTGERRNQPIIGLLILRNMRRHSATEYGGGDILDPDTGSVYRCKITVEDGGKKLVVRGFLGISLIGRSQVWIRQD